VIFGVGALISAADAASGSSTATTVTRMVFMGSFPGISVVPLP
jgi:hypothetical protein